MNTNKPKCKECKCIGYHKMDCSTGWEEYRQEQLKKKETENV